MMAGDKKKKSETETQPITPNPYNKFDILNSVVMDDTGSYSLKNTSSDPATESTDTESTATDCNNVARSEPPSMENTESTADDTVEVCERKNNELVPGAASSPTEKEQEIEVTNETPSISERQKHQSSATQLLQEDNLDDPPVPKSEETTQTQDENVDQKTSNKPPNRSLAEDTTSRAVKAADSKAPLVQQQDQLTIPLRAVVIEEKVDHSHSGVQAATKNETKTDGQVTAQFDSAPPVPLKKKIATATTATKSKKKELSTTDLLKKLLSLDKFEQKDAAVDAPRWETHDKETNTEASAEHIWVLATKNEVLQRNLDKLHQETMQYKDKSILQISQLTDDLKSAKSRVVELETHNKKLKESEDSLRSKLWDAQCEVADLKYEIERLDIEDVRLRKEVSEFETLKKISQSIQESSQSASNAISTTASETNVTSMESTGSYKLLKRIADAESKTLFLEMSAEFLEEELERVNQNSSDLQTKNDELEGRVNGYAALQSMYEELLQENERLRQSSLSHDPRRSTAPRGMARGRGRGRGGGREEGS